MSVNQNEIDALLSSGGQVDDNEGSKKSSVDDIVAETIAAESAAGKNNDSSSTEKANVNTASVSSATVDTSTLSTNDSLDQMRSAQKILFEVFSNIPDKKDRSRLLNWANDAFIKSKFF